MAELLEIPVVESKNSIYSNILIVQNSQYDIIYQALSNSSFVCTVGNPIITFHTVWGIIEPLRTRSTYDCV